MSKEYWASLPDLPKPKEGLHIKLYHLTSDTRVLGYIKTTVFAKAKDGVIVSFDLEACAVRNMKVPLLLGEDFQTMYKLSVTCYTTGHSEVIVGKTGWIVLASSAQGVDLGFEIQQAHTAQLFIRRKALKQLKAKVREDQATPQEVVVAEDTLIVAGSVHNVLVEAQLES
jgi:hypothetical protein